MNITTYYHPLEMMERILSNQLTVEKNGYKIEEEDQSFLLKIPLPGLSKKDITIEVSSGVLSISGKKTDSSWFGDFTKKFKIPLSVDPNEVGAKMEEGILTINLAKKKESLPKKIVVS